MTLTTKIIMSGIPFLILASTPSDVVTIADEFMKYGELGLCFALVAYLVYSNYCLVDSLQKLIKEKSAQEERLINAIQTFCAVCRERPCLVEANAFKVDNPDGIVHAAGGNQ
jgi:FtsH-binding integral membrane protein